MIGYGQPGCAYHCPVCGTNGTDASHQPGSEVCRLLREERDSKTRC